MRKIRALITVFALASAAAMAGGGFALYGSYADMKDFDDAGYGGGLKLQADLGTPYLGFELRIQGMTGYGGDDPATEDSYLASGEANLRLTLPVGEVLRLYVGAGAGYYVFPEYESKEPVGDSLEPDIDPEDVWGFFAVAGAELMLSESFGLFAEVKYLVAEVEEVDIDDETVEIDEGDFGGFGVNAGILFRF